MSEEARPLVIPSGDKVHAYCRVGDHLAMKRSHDGFVDMMPVHSGTAECGKRSGMNVERASRVELLCQFQPTGERKKVSAAFAC